MMGNLMQIFILWICHCTKWTHWKHACMHIEWTDEKSCAFRVHCCVAFKILLRKFQTESHVKMTKRVEDLNELFRKSTLCNGNGVSFVIHEKCCRKVCIFVIFRRYFSVDLNLTMQWQRRLMNIVFKQRKSDSHIFVVLSKQEMLNFSFCFVLYLFVGGRGEVVNLWKE